MKKKREINNKIKKRIIIYSIIISFFIGLVLIKNDWFMAATNNYFMFWSPERTITTENYIIYSTATEAQTEKTVDLAEELHECYLSFLKDFDIKPISYGKLKLKLYKNREEFRRYNNITGWAEAYYLHPYCYQYYSEKEVNPYHWMLHEATHQLNNEVADFSSEKWLEEGLADYFGSSKLIDGKLTLGEIDINTYPVWWMKTLAVSGNLEEDKKNLSIIPLRSIISNSNGPNINSYFNLYYLHWWTLTYFLMHYENGKYKNGVEKLLKNGSDVKSFEKHIGNIEQIEQEWYAYIKTLKEKLAVPVR